MNAAQLLERMTASGFSVVLEASRIIVSPADRLTDDLRAAIRANRDDLAVLLDQVELEAAALIERLRQSAPARWTGADVAEARRNACRDYPAGINCLRALTRSKG